MKRFKIMNVLIAITMLCCILEIVSAQSDVLNVRVQWQDRLLHVTYDLTVTADVEVHVSFDGGANYTGPLQNVSGDAGKAIYPGNDKILVCSAVDELAGYVNNSNVLVKIVAVSSSTSGARSNMLVSYCNRTKSIYVYEDERFRFLPQNEVRQIMKDTYADDALQWYDKSVRINENSDIWFYPVITFPVGMIYKAASKNALRKSVKSYNYGLRAPVKGWYCKNSFAFEFAAGVIVDGDGDVSVNLGVIYTRNISHNFGFDIVKLKYDWCRPVRSPQILTGIRGYTRPYGRNKYLNFYYSLKGGLGYMNYFADNYKHYNNVTKFVMELDYGIKTRNYNLGISAETRGFEFYSFGFKVGFDIGRRIPY